MESRFGFKDFVFAVLFVLVIGAVAWMSQQFNYNEKRLTEVKEELVRMGKEQQQQLDVLSDIRNTLREGVRVNGPRGATTQSATQADETGDGRIRRTNPDGSVYVYYPEAPSSQGREPRNEKDYAVGDWLVQNLDSEPKVLTPYIEKDYVAQQVHMAVYECLLQQNQETFEFEPVLAESYWMSGDGKTFRFKLRPNICFSDGTPVRVEDVIFSYNTIMTPGVDSAALRIYFEKVKSVTKVDDRTVEFQLSEPYFLSLGYIGAGLPIIPEHVYKFNKPEEYNSRSDVLVSTGPYRMDRWDRGQQIVLVRNEHYWGKRPTFDRLIFKFISNEQAALQAFEDGQIDQIEPVGDQFLKFSKDPEFLQKFQAYKYLRVNSGWAFIAYNLKRPQFKDRDTRLALSMLLDKQAMIDTLIKKMGEQQPGPFNTLSKQHDPSIKPVPYNPEGAKALLASAGWKPGADGVLERDGVKFEFDLSMGAGSPTMDRLANYIKNQFASAGIRMRITPWEFSVLNEHLDNRDFDAVTMSWMMTSDEDDPFQLWHSSSMKDKGSNFLSWDNKESDALIEEARVTMDPDKRNAIWHKWEKLIVDQQPYTFLWTRYDRLFVNGRFRNTKPYKLNYIPYDWYVPAGLQQYH